MYKYRKLILIMLLPIFLLSLCGCGKKKTDKMVLSVWGIESSEDYKGIDEAIAEFERRHPNIEVRNLSMGAGGMNPQKLMTAVAGGVPPDIVYQGRFTIGDFASRDTFIPLNDLIERDRDKPFGIKPEEFYKACWDEATYEGKVYGIPTNTDDRALYYNKTLFKKAGLDPNRPPRTWDELLAYSKKLTVYNKDKSFKQIGFIPMFGNCFFYMYSWQNDGEFMSPDGRTCTLNNANSVQALDYLVKFYDSFDGIDAINSFQSGFKADALDPFLTGQVAMKIDGNWFMNRVARYAPGMDFGVAPAPVPRARYEGKPPLKGESQFITWSGGFSFVIPRGARHTKEAWEFIKWMVSPEATRAWNEAGRRYNEEKGRPFVPALTANSRVNEMVFREFAPKSPRLREPFRLFIDLMDVSRYRPVTFVGQRLWDEHMRAFEQAVYHKQSPEDALNSGTEVVQKELDKAFSRENYGLLDWRYPLAIVGVLLLAFIVFAAKKLSGIRHSGRLSKNEAVAGYVFVSPWIIGFLVFTAGPIIASIVLSFCDYDVLHAARWVGIRNYFDLFNDDWTLVSKTLYNAGFLALFGLPLNMATGLGIAMLLNTKVRGMTWYRTVYYLPAIVPIIANAILWLWVLNPQFGLLNSAWQATLTQWFHITPPLWLGNEVTAKPALVIMGLWGAGGGMIIWLAGLQGVPQYLYEAAEIDGASWWSRFWHVTLPMLTPYLFFNLIMGTIGVLQTFESIYVMTGGAGGPVDSTMVPVLYLFNNAFAYFKMGYASALAWLLFMIILVLTLIQLKLAPRWVHYESEK